MKPNSLTILLITVTLLLLGCTTSARAGSPNSAIVLAVIDGDTVRVQYAGAMESVRLIGIDTPESRKNPRAYRNAKRAHHPIETELKLGRRATEFLETLLPPGETVTLEFDVERRDRYGRLLAYLRLPDGRMINAILVEEGYAMSYTVPPNVRYAGEFVRLMRHAREAQRGLWSPDLD